MPVAPPEIMTGVPTRLGYLAKWVSGTRLLLTCRKRERTPHGAHIRSAACSRRRQETVVSLGLPDVSDVSVECTNTIILRPVGDASPANPVSSSRRRGCLDNRPQSARADWW